MTRHSANFPWHEGEVAVQRRLGVAERMAEMGSKVVRDHMPAQHRELYAKLPYMIAGTVDPSGDVWATILTGKPGFVSSPDHRTLAFGAPRDLYDPADAGMETGDAIGLLGIELSSRRRNRMNGTIRRDGAGGFAVAVGHSFGNCPQYIQLRDYEFARDPARPSGIEAETLAVLDDDARAAIAAADTFFVASYVDLEGGERQVDVSHRGGKPGFVRIDENGRLTIPDFAGNLHYNTLGNFTVNPRAGLIFADFETGDVLQLTGDAEIEFDSPEIKAFQGAERIWHFTPRRIVRRRGALALRWLLQQNGFSPNALMTGSWEDTAARIEAEKLAMEWRAMKVSKVVEESASIRSFHLEPADGKGLIAHKAGQHLPIRVTLPGADKPVLRTYTLSCAPSDNRYRISVKRDGAVSQYLHDHVGEGGLIEARGPAGSFTVDAAEKRPAVLIAAGVGITPMLAMLRHIVYEGVRTRGVRPTWLVHVARSKTERAFDAEIDALADAAQGAVRVIRIVSRPGPDERPGRDYNGAGRFEAATFSQFLPFGDYDFYMCGPGGFMQAMYDGLRDLNVADARIHAEAFGPSSLTRRADVGAASLPQEKPATESVPVIFTASAKEARWEPGQQTLLELAEARGIDASFSCRAGNCGMCAAKLLKGRVAYTNTPSADIPEGHVLVCSAVPAADSEPLEIEL